MTLFELTKRWQEFDAFMEEIGGDVSDPRVSELVDAELAGLEADTEIKADAYAAYIRELESRAEARINEAHRIMESAKRSAKLAETLSTRLRDALKLIGKRKVIGSRYTVSVAANGGKLPILYDEGACPVDALPETFVRVELSADKVAMRDALERGETLPFARFGERGDRLQIR